MLGSLKKIPDLQVKKKPNNLFKFTIAEDKAGTEVFLSVGDDAEALGAGACVGDFDGECEGD